MKADSPFKAWLAKGNKVLLVVLRPLQIVNNFIFLAIAYVLGVGLSALIYRLGPGRRKKAAAARARDSYWIEMPPAPRDRDAWLRPF